MVGSTLARYHTHFLAFDSEAESLNLGFARPWQVAWGLHDAKGNMQWIKVRYIWFPDLCVSRGAAEITRFDYATYKAGALPAKEVWEELRKDMVNPLYRIVWQSGLHYDSWVLRNWARECGGAPLDPSYLLRTIDTNAILKAIAKGWKPDVSSPEAFLRWQYQAVGWIEKGLKTNLTDAGKSRDIEHDYATTHDAASDITLMAKVFGQAVYELDF